MPRSKSSVKRARKGTVRRTMRSSMRSPMRSLYCGNRGAPDTNAIVATFMEMANLVKIFHWNTRSYAQHKATDELHSRLGENVDKFIEILLGKRETRFRNLRKSVSISQQKPREFKARIYWFRDYLTHLDACFGKRDTDLLNIRDEILGDVNQFLYLWTLKH